MKEWLKTLIGAVCILTILLNLIPEGKYAKYVRFYAGLIFFLMAASPLLELLAGEGLLGLLQMEFLREDYSELELAVDGMKDLKDDRIRLAYQQEILRQIEEAADACGLGSSEVEVSFDREDGYGINGVSVRLEGEEGSADGAAAGRLREEISSIYGVNPGRILIEGQGGSRL